MPPLQGRRQFAAPRDCDQKDLGRLPAQRLYKLCQVVKQTAKAWCIAALLFIQAGATTIQEEHLEIRSAQTIARMRIPAAVALDAVEANHAGSTGTVRK